jgi:hypothetical protein
MVWALALCWFGKVMFFKNLTLTGYLKINFFAVSFSFLFQSPYCEQTPVELFLR